MKRIKNLRIARIIQWTNGGVAWLTVCFVYRMMVPLVRQAKRLWRVRSREEARIEAHVPEVFHDRP